MFRCCTHWPLRGERYFVLRTSAGTEAGERFTVTEVDRANITVICFEPGMKYLKKFSIEVWFWWMNQGTIQFEGYGP